jgi:DNA-binding transcriptional LysR family regulator
MSALIKEQYGLLRLGASTTISQYLIPPLLARFHQEMRVSKSFYEMEIQNKLKSLLDKEIETGIVGQSKNKALNTCRFLNWY